MPTVTESDLKELKDLITARFDETNGKIQSLDNKFNLYAAKTDEKLESLKEGLADLKKQSEKQDNRQWVLFSGMFLALLGIIAKFAFSP
jgi:ferritin-like metal-binding protein YciE